MTFVDASLEYPSGLALQNAKDASVQRLEDVDRPRGTIIYINIEIPGETFHRGCSIKGMKITNQNYPLICSDMGAELPKIIGKRIRDNPS
jgi:hypothetical protein